MDFELERQKCLDRILSSNAFKRLIVAGPGTGKTYTFGQVLNSESGSSNIAMTFIRKLVDDMAREFSDLAEVHTFHKYCKKTLHRQLGSFCLVPQLPKIIESDAAILRLNFTGFKKKFQLMQTDCKEIEFYLSRSNYYSAISFDDCVFRLLTEASKNPEMLPEFNLLVVDEFQDFNPLEVALIDLLERRGKILIVGDDDQSVYDAMRSASPDYLRRKFYSGEYETFDLPYCSRCTDVVVKAVKSVLSKATESGLMQGRIDKPFACYLPDKYLDNELYPTIIAIRCTTISTVCNYLAKSIQSIRQDDVIESNKPGSEYYTALVIGPHHYLQVVAKVLRKKFSRLEYFSKKENMVLIEDAFELLYDNEESNMGWRIALECVDHGQDLEFILKESVRGRRMIDLIRQDYVDSIKKALEILVKVKNQIELNPFEDRFLVDLLKSDYERVLDNFTPTEEVTNNDFDDAEPTIGLTTYVGSKGLSAGHVFILGMNEGDLPRKNGDISDAEVSRFLVSLTRTRKQCHLISNKWLFSPKGPSGVIPPHRRSRFIDWLSTDILTNHGDVNAARINSLF